MLVLLQPRWSCWFGVQMLVNQHLVGHLGCMDLHDACSDIIELKNHTKDGLVDVIVFYLKKTYHVMESRTFILVSYQSEYFS